MISAGMCLLISAGMCLLISLFLHSLIICVFLILLFHLLSLEEQAVHNPTFVSLSGQILIQTISFLFHPFIIILHFLFYTYVFVPFPPLSSYLIFLLAE